MALRSHGEKDYIFNQFSFSINCPTNLHFIYVVSVIDTIASMKLNNEFILKRSNQPDY